MNSEKVKDLLQEKLLDCQIEVEINGSHYNVTVVGDIFEGKRQFSVSNLFTVLCKSR